MFYLERERVASHSILLSTVQYLYVHPMVLTWVALPEKKKILTPEDNSKSREMFLLSIEVVRTQHT